MKPILSKFKTRNFNKYFKTKNVFMTTRLGHSPAEIPLYTEEELKQEVHQVKQDLDNSFYEGTPKSLIPEIEYSQEISEYLADPSRANQLVENKSDEAEFKQYVSEHLQELKETVRVSPEYLTNTVRLTNEERSKYVKEIDNLSYQGLVEYYNRGWKNANIHYILWLGKSLDAIEKLGLNESQRATAFYDFEFSDGNFTLDFAHTSPFPHHTFDEIPIIKETPGVEDQL
eukprot:TRINITY_DN4073_c0_g1_i1.p1 TRINITY_DN4073_c0_g1~~TRINITY_DN4073_c0_g1_i1.p1  ORF type:complete len:229 (+),score=60.49 TRINITY_DN4073_c0_g1_i1:39-725(+)